MTRLGYLAVVVLALPAASCSSSDHPGLLNGRPAVVGGSGAGGGTSTVGGGMPNGGTGAASSTGGASATGGQRTGGATGAGGATGGRATGGMATGGTAAVGGTPSGGLPALHVSGTAIYDSNNNQVILRGASTIDVGCPLNWNGINDAVQQTKASIDLVTASGWKTRVVRLPVYGSGSTRAGQPNNFPENGPVSAQDNWYNSVLKPAVDYATSKNLYAIVDWHEIASASTRNAATRAFWTYLAPKLKNQSNILYEVFNEDSDTNEWTDWRPLAQGWVDIVRNAGANNLVLVGGPMWAQTIGGSAKSPITGGNIVYVAHMYPSHYNDAWAKNHIETELALAAGAAPVFITEWGYSTGDSNSANYVAWVKNFASTYGTSWTAWVISPSWGPPMFNSDRSLTPFGQTAKDWLGQY